MQITSTGLTFKRLGVPTANGRCFWAITPREEQTTEAKEEETEAKEEEKTEAKEEETTEAKEEEKTEAKEEGQVRSTVSSLKKRKKNFKFKA